MFRKRYAILTVFLTLILAVAPVYAAPALKVGSTASYSLAASLIATQSCTASPATYYNQACLGIYPSLSTSFVSIFDNATGTCNAVVCGFSPATLYVSAGTQVVWTNNGRLAHTVVSNVTANVGLESFSSGILNSGWSFSHVFGQQGVYHYYDSNYLSVRGTVNVAAAPPPPPPPTPMPSTFQVDLNGNIGWTVQGLSTDQTNLLVSHNIGVSVSIPQFPGLTITPVTESGSLVQSINLATRVESAGTATDLIEHILTTYAAASSSTPYSSYGGLGSALSQLASSASSDPSYTFWWVNGPLSNGSPVQVMDGWASVTGSETLNLGTLGNVQAWIVTSQFSQNVNVNMPSLPLGSPGSSAQATLNLNFLWSYDKGSDLLARSLANGTVTAHSVSTTQVSTGYCYYYPCTTTPVQVTRDMRLMLTLALHLSSTSLNLDKRMANGGQTIDMASILSYMMATPLTSFGILGAAAAAIIAFSLWLTRRTTRTPTPQASPMSGPPAQAPPTPPTTA